MGALSSLALARIQKPERQDPVQAARKRILANLSQQREVLAAALDGKQYKVATKRRRQSIDGSRVEYETEKRIRAWFFALNGGWYVQCKLGNRPLTLADDKNAVFVQELAAVEQVFTAFEQAVLAGELDAAFNDKPQKAQAKPSKAVQKA
jgi:hypothetical protein